MVVEDGCFAEEGTRRARLVFGERGEVVEGWRGVDGSRELHLACRVYLYLASKGKVTAVCNNLFIAVLLLKKWHYCLAMDFVYLIGL